jgi:hypothetical protein
LGAGSKSQKTKRPVRDLHRPAFSKRKKIYFVGLDAVKSEQHGLPTG